MSTTETEPAAPPAEPAGEVSLTNYVILSGSAGGTWKEQTRVEARGATAALRSWLNGIADKEGTYIAVPARSWKPVTVKTETQTTIKLT